MDTQPSILGIATGRGGIHGHAAFHPGNCNREGGVSQGHAAFHPGNCNREGGGGRSRDNPPSRESLFSTKSNSGANTLLFPSLSVCCLAGDECSCMYCWRGVLVHVLLEMSARACIAGDECSCMYCWRGVLVHVLLERSARACIAGEECSCMYCWRGVLVHVLLERSARACIAGDECSCMYCWRRVLVHVLHPLLVPPCNSLPPPEHVIVVPLICSDTIGAMNVQPTTAISPVHRGGSLDQVPGPARPSSDGETDSGWCSPWRGVLSLPATTQ